MSDQPEGPGNVQPGGEERPEAELQEAEETSPEQSGDGTTDNASGDDRPTRSGFRLSEAFKQQRGSLFPKLAYTAAFPKIELPDLSTLLRPLAAQLERAGRALAPLVKQLLESLPPNWPIDLDPDKLTTVIQDDGLPLVWVPRAEIVSELLTAPDRPARIALLLARADEIVEDCRQALSEVTHAALSGQQSLAVRALDAFEVGYHEAAQALAVVVTETAVTRYFGYKDYGQIKKAVNFDPDLVGFTELRVMAALAPVGPFFTSWRPGKGIPPPEPLSRHVSVHQADMESYTRGDGIVAVLLVSSVLRALQELQEFADASAPGR